MNRDDQRRIDHAMGRIKRPKTLHCRWCQGRMTVEKRGRVPEYCSAVCRQRAYERRKWSPTLVTAAAEDIGEARLKALIRKEIRDALRKLGIQVDPPPPPRPKPNLKLVPK